MGIVKVKQVVTYGGHSITAKGIINFTLKADYSELVNTIKLMQMLNNDINIKAKLPDKKAIALGSFRIKQINIDSDGESFIKFTGLSDYIETDNLNQMPLESDDFKLFSVMYECEIEEENKNENYEGEE